MERIQDMLDFRLLNTGNFSIQISTIFYLLLLIIVTMLIITFLKKILYSRFMKKALPVNQAYVTFQIIKYFIIVFAIAIGLESLGLKLTILLAGSAALFVGIGLGVQEIFKDIISGFIILFGKAVKIGDVLEVDGIVGRITEIGFRTTTMLTRDDINMIIPNSKFILNNIINWSYHNNLTRFKLIVGVAYGSDVDMVKLILLECAKSHHEVSAVNAPFVRFINFGNSSLDFELFFWSKNIFRIENVMSDLRFAIDRRFRESQVVISFPQIDIHLKDVPKGIEKKQKVS